MPQPVIGNLESPLKSLLDDHPQLFIHVGRIASHWTLVELQLGALLTTMLNDKANLAIPMYMEIRSDAAKLSAIDAVAKETLDSTYFSEYEAIRKKVESIRTQRNKIVHSLWIAVESEPPAFVMASPKALLHFVASFSPLIGEKIFPSFSLDQINNLKIAVEAGVKEKQTNPDFNFSPEIIQDILKFFDELKTRLPLIKNLAKKAQPLADSRYVYYESDFLDIDNRIMLLRQELFCFCEKVTIFMKKIN